MAKVDFDQRNEDRPSDGTIEEYGVKLGSDANATFVARRRRVLVTTTTKSMLSGLTGLQFGDPQQRELLTRRGGDRSCRFALRDQSCC